MAILAALFAAAALVVGSPEYGFATVEIEGPPGAELHIDGRPVTIFDAEGRVLLQLSAETHRLTVKRGRKVLESRDVEFGAGSRIHLEMW